MLSYMILYHSVSCLCMCICIYIYIYTHIYIYIYTHTRTLTCYMCICIYSHRSCVMCHVSFDHLAWDQVKECRGYLAFGGTDQKWFEKSETTQISRLFLNDSHYYHPYMLIPGRLQDLRASSPVKP